VNSHETADYQILLDTATNYILAHASGAGLEVLPPIWDDGFPRANVSLHHVRIATREAQEELSVPHEWLAVENEGHNRFRTEVEAALARLRARQRSVG
jgi:hypothetical protein